jgi:hypothetical protein
MSSFLLVPTHCNRCIVQVRRTRDMYRTFFFSCMLIKTRSEYFISRHLQIASLRCNSRERSIDNTINDLLFSIQNLSTKCVPHRVFPQKIPHLYFVQLQQSPKISPCPVFVSLKYKNVLYMFVSHVTKMWRYMEGRRAQLGWEGTSKKGEITGKSDEHHFSHLPPILGLQDAIGGVAGMALSSCLSEGSCCHWHSAMFCFILLKAFRRRIVAVYIKTLFLRIA